MTKFYKVYHLGCICWDGEASNHKAALEAGIASNEALDNEAASLSQHLFQYQFQRVRDAHSVRLEYKVIEHRAAETPVQKSKGGKGWKRVELR
jgi:hypothetical protein